MYILKLKDKTMINSCKLSFSIKGNNEINKRRGRKIEFHNVESRKCLAYPGLT